MTRKKNYQATDARAAQAIAVAPQAVRQRPNAEDAYIDMKEVQGPGARFTGTQRVIDLRNWIGRGIDAWVFTTGYCLKAMLRSGARETRSIVNYAAYSRTFFEYLTSGTQARPRVSAPENLVPLHIQAVVGWLQKESQARGWTKGSARNAYKSIKAVLVEMLAQGFIPGDRSRFFPRGAVTWRVDASRQTSLSDAEQDCLARAIKSDLAAIHHGRLTLGDHEVQALRLLVVAHRQGLNPTPLLEMSRDALSPGFLPGTVRIQTMKHRNKKVRSGIGRAAGDQNSLVFTLSEGAVLQQAIVSTQDLVLEAPDEVKDRVWLYRCEGGHNKGRVTCLAHKGLVVSIRSLVARHKLLGNDGKPLRLNLSRLRKSFFDRGLRAADGDLAVTANLMGNTPNVASLNYPSMNDARQAEAAGFMNDDYPALMRASVRDGEKPSIELVKVTPFKEAKSDVTTVLPVHTPVSGCMDSVNGEHAPHDGRSHCDRYVMCLFCSSFAIVGTVGELWRLFSFQVFAKAELQFLDSALGVERTRDEAVEDLRDRYRLAIPYIDDFTQRQFARTKVARARAKTEDGLHPYWQHQMTMSRRARSKAAVPGNYPGSEAEDETSSGDRFGT